MPTTIKPAVSAGDLQCPQWTRGQAASGQAGRHLPQLKEAALVSWSVGPPRPAPPPPAADRPAPPGRSSEQLVRGGGGRR